MATVVWEEAIPVPGAARRGWKWLSRHFAVVVLVLTSAGLAVGLLLHVAGAGDAGNALWAAVGGCGAAYALWAMADALRHGRVGVDVIALLAVGGALAVGELLAAAVIAVMLASSSPTASAPMSASNAMTSTPTRRWRSASAMAHSA